MKKTVLKLAAKAAYATAKKAGNSEIKVNGKTAENGEYTLALTGDDAKVVTEIEVGNENTVAGKYTVSILREEPVTITFETEPKDAIITVIDKDKIKAGGEDGIYKVLPGDRKSTRLNSSHANESRMPSSA